MKLPQFDASSFPSQLFWLVVSFTIFYMLMSRLILPTVVSVIEGRKNRIKEDLDRAEAMRLQAISLEKEYSESLTNARSKAAEIVMISAKKSEQKAAERLGELDQSLSKKLMEAEKALLAKREQSMDALNKKSADLARNIVKQVAEIQVSADKANSITAKLIKKVV